MENDKIEINPLEKEMINFFAEEFGTVEFEYRGKTFKFLNDYPNTSMDKLMDLEPLEMIRESIFILSQEPKLTRKAISVMSRKCLEFFGKQLSDTIGLKEKEEKKASETIP